MLGIETASSACPPPKKKQKTKKKKRSTSPTRLCQFLLHFQWFQLTTLFVAWLVPPPPPHAASPPKAK